MTSTRIRLMSCNFRLTPESEEDIAEGHTWSDVRKPLALKLLKDWAPSAFCAQEMSATIRADVALSLGASWRHVRNGNVAVWWHTARHELLDEESFMLPSPAPADGSATDPRRLILAKFRAKSTGEVWWAASTHFSSTAPDWQIKQMVAACDYIHDYGAANHVIFGGDFNAGATAGDGPRQIGRANALFDLRGKLASWDGPDSRIKNAQSNSYNGWRIPCLREGRWIDDIFTGEKMQPYYARVIDTAGASDHQWLIASTVRIG